MSDNSLEQLIVWEDQAISPDTKGELRDAIDAALEGLVLVRFALQKKL